MSIINYFNRLVGEKCNSFVGGKGPGSIISLKIGPQTLKDKAIENPHISENARLYDSEFGLLIYCCWRISVDGQITCSWRDALGNNGKVLKELNKLCDKEITEIRLCEKTYDLSIIFKNGICLEIFCDVTNDYDSDENYIFYTPEKNITIGLNSVVEIESKTND